MSVLLAVAIKPKNSKPYVLIGVDSKRVYGTLKNSDNCDLNSLETCFIDENYEKAFKLKNIIYGFTGKIDSEMLESLKDFMENRDYKIDALIPELEKYLRSLLKSNNYIKEQKCIITIVGLYRDEPTIIQVCGFKEDLSVEIRSGIVQQYTDNISIAYAGRTMEYDLQKEFEAMLKGSVTLKKETVIKAMRKYLKKAAARYPETCNQNIKILELE